MAWGMLAVVLAAYALRAFHLGGPSLGFDEAFDMAAASRGPSYILALLGSQEPYPPLHFLALHVWIRLAGDSEFAARYLSLGFGVLAVPLLYRLGRCLGGGSTGLAAAALAAASPAYVWYSQESKMYPLVTFFALLSTYQFVRLTSSAEPGRGHRRAWIAYVAATAVALYAHYPALFVVLAHNLLALARLASVPGQRGSFLRVWGGSQLAVLALLAPWLLYVSGLLRGYHSVAPGSADPLALIRQFWRVFGVGYSDEVYNRLGGIPEVTIAFVVILLVGVGYLTWRRPWGGLVAAGYLIVPLALVLALSQWRAVFAARHLAVVSPAWYLLLGAGLAGLGQAPVPRLARPALLAGGLGIVVAVLGVSLAGYYYDPAYRRTDNRAVGAFLTQQAREGDVVVYSAPYFHPAVRYYFRAAVPWIGLPEEGLQLDEERTAVRLAEIASRYERVWLVLWQDYATDPHRFIEQWLDRNLDRIEDRRFTSIALRGYSATASTLKPSFAIPTRLEANLGGQVAFLGYDLESNVVSPGGSVQLVLYWRAEHRLDRRFTVFTHLVDREWQMLAQHDGQPHEGMAPTPDWRPGEVIADRHTLLVPADLAAGEYWIQTGMYEIPGLQRLEVLDQSGQRRDDKVLIGPVRVQPGAGVRRQ